MSSEHVEVLREMLDDAAIEPPWKPEEVAAITAAIASLSAPQPEGEWVLVPRNPTEAMLDSAESAMIESECAYNAGEHDARSDAHGFPTMRIWQAVVGYRAMLAAAPQPPSAPVGVEGLPEKWRREAPRARVDVGEDASLAWREAVYWCAFQLEAALAAQQGGAK